VSGIAHPAVAWLVFIGVTWGIHVGPLFAAALDDSAIHELEHVALLAAALLFWSPVVAVDPVPWRLDDGARLAYVALAMPLLSALGLLIYSWPGVMWADYAAHARALGLDGLDDQRLAGMVMWLGSDLLMLGVLAYVLISGPRTPRHRRTGAWPVAFAARDQDRATLRSLRGRPSPARQPHSASPVLGHSDHCFANRVPAATRPGRIPRSQLRGQGLAEHPPSTESGRRSRGRGR
jgi:hypothetical protein